MVTMTSEKPKLPSVFDYLDYKEYLRVRLEYERTLRRGAQARLAEAMGCQSAWVSMVLSEKGDLTAEQGNAAATLYSLSRNEGHYFVLLILKARAGTAALRDYFQKQIQELLDGRKSLANRLTDARVFPVEEQSVFYSSWSYAAAHISLTVPRLQSIDAASRYLGLPKKTVIRLLDYFVSCGLATEGDGAYKVGPTRTHLAKTSLFSRQHHSNWRLQAISNLESDAAQDFHYTSVISAARRDMPKVQEIMMRAIEEIRAVVKESPEEDVFCYLMDLFCLDQSSP